MSREPIDRSRREARAEELLERAQRLPPEERDGFLDVECEGDPPLRAEIERLLRYADELENAEGFLKSPLLRRDASEGAPAGDLTAEVPQVEPAEDGQIGPYRLLRRIAEGGMGEVWEAEQTEPVRRRIALKVIKRGMDTAAVITRFEAERQALALMDHPYVAKVFDAGATPRGRPYFVMEYVKGVPINEHCDRQQLTARERLELFVRVCEGVQHAHHKAIIHRDLKPSNVLVETVNGKALPKVIDFGIAKATGKKLTERTMVTELGVLVGTPEYMSPEQTDLFRQDVDTRTDVYALGVMLYQLLVGALPFSSEKLRAGGIDDLRRTIREEEPPTPSSRLATLGDRGTSARLRGVAVATLQRQLRGELDWITMKALEKERARRYGSPQELAEDIQRYLRDEPVLARAPSRAYRARKFVRRNKWGVAVAAAAVVVLIAWGSTMAVQARRIAAQRDVAEQARADLESVVDFQAGMLSATDPQAMGRHLMNDLRRRVEEAEFARGRTEAQVASTLAAHDRLMSGVSATDLALGLVDEDILGQAVSELEERFAEKPLIEARLRLTIGDAYRKLGRYERAEPQLEAALATRESVLGPDHPDTFSSMNALAVLYWSQGRYADAEPLYLETLAREKRVLGADHPETLRYMNNLAALYVRQGRHAEAEPLLLETLENRKRVLGADDKDTLSSMNNLAGLYRSQGRYAEAEPLYLETLATRKRLLGGEHPQTLRSMSNLASLYASQGRYAEAEPLLLETLAARVRVLGEKHPQTAGTLYNLACLEALRGDRPKAMERLEQAVDAGLAAADHMVRDPDLTSLHGPEFDSLVERARENARNQQDD